MVIAILIYRVVVIAWGIGTPFVTKTSCFSLKVGILTRYYICTNCSTSGVSYGWVTTITYPLTFKKINGFLGPLILE